MKKLHIYFERPKKQASEPIEVKTQELLSSYMYIKFSEDYVEERKLQSTPDGYTGESSVIAPVPVPQVLRLFFVIPNKEGSEQIKFDLKALYKGEWKQLSTKIVGNRKEGALQILEVELYNLSYLVGNQYDFSTSFLAQVKAGADRSIIIFEMRTPPTSIAIEEIKDFENRGQWVDLRKDFRVMPVMKYQITNPRPYPYILEFPVELSGQFYRQYKSTEIVYTNEKQDGWDMATKPFRSSLSTQFILALDDRPVHDFLLEAPLEKSFKISITPNQKINLTLYAVLNMKHYNFNTSRVCWISPQGKEVYKPRSPDCKIFSNGRIFCYNGSSYPALCSGQCEDVQWTQLPSWLFPFGSTTNPFRNWIQVIGHGYETEDFWKKSKLYYSDITLHDHTPIGSLEGPPLWSMINGEYSNDTLIYDELTVCSEN